MVPQDGTRVNRAIYLITLRTDTILPEQGRVIWRCNMLKYFHFTIIDLNAVEFCVG